jgi:hypothetical protein
LEAERILASDGVVTVHESVPAEVEKPPEPKELEASFDEEVAYAAFVAEFQARQARCGDIVWCPADWWVIPKALWYHEFGYESALIRTG